MYFIEHNKSLMNLSNTFYNNLLALRIFPFHMVIHTN